MSEILAKDGTGERQQAGAADETVSDWFAREILPLEALLMHYLRRNWQNASELADLRQEVYARVFDAARGTIPDNPKRYLLTTARNLLINLVRREHIVQIEIVADLDGLDVASEGASPDRVAVARGELRRFQEALAKLPPHLRDVLVFTYIEDLRLREIALRMRVNKSTVSRYLTRALQDLADILHGDQGSDRHG